jgi:hypothetical protein
MIFIFCQMIIYENKSFFKKSLFHEYLNNKLSLKILINDLDINKILFLVIKNVIYHQIFDD